MSHSNPWSFPSTNIYFNLKTQSVYEYISRFHPRTGHYFFLHQKNRQTLALFWSLTKKLDDLWAAANAVSKPHPVFNKMRKSKWVSSYLPPPILRCKNLKPSTLVVHPGSLTVRPLKISRAPNGKGKQSSNHPLFRGKLAVKLRGCRFLGSCSLNPMRILQLN